MAWSERGDTAPEATAKVVNGHGNRKKLVVVGLGMVGIAFMYGRREMQADGVLSIYQRKVDEA